MAADSATAAATQVRDEQVHPDTQKHEQQAANPQITQIATVTTPAIAGAACNTLLMRGARPSTAWATHLATSGRHPVPANP